MRLCLNDKEIVYGYGNQLKKKDIENSTSLKDVCVPRRNNSNIYRGKIVGVYKNAMKDFLKEIGNLGISHIEFESLVILLMCAVLVYILFRYQSKFSIKFFNNRLSSINKKRSANARASKQLLKFITTQEQCSPKKTKCQEISHILGTILITDDDKNLCEVLADIIEEQFNKFSIETANDGEEALRHIDRHSPSLLILDLKMPRKTGFEVLEELSTRNEKFPILVISSDPRSKKEIIRQVHISNDRFEYLHKTFSTKEFVDTIQNMLSLQEN